MPEPTAVIDTLRQVRWDAPYRLLASVAGLSAFAAGTPLDAARDVTSWLGFSVTADLATAERWLLEPSRRDVFAPICVVVVLAAAASLWSYGRYGLPNAESRAGATLVLAYATLVQLGTWPSPAIALVAMTALGLWLGLAWRGRKGERFLAVFWDTCLGLFWAPLVIGGWALLRESLVPAAADVAHPATEQASTVAGPSGSPVVRPRPTGGL